MKTTVFTQKAQRFRGSNALWLVMVLLSIILALFAKQSGYRHWVLIKSVSSVFIFLYLGSRNRKEEIVFMVNRDGDNFYFTYKDEDHLRMDDVKIEEYDYWYYTDGGSDGKTKFVLVMKVVDENGTYFFKEKLLQKEAPQGWAMKNEKVHDQKDVLLIPGLRNLAALIDQHAEIPA